MWHGMAAASPPAALMASATGPQLSRRRLETTTRAPASASVSAMARPIPLDDPVTTATRPRRSNRSR